MREWEKEEGKEGGREREGEGGTRREGGGEREGKMEGGSSKRKEVRLYNIIGK